MALPSTNKRQKLINAAIGRFHEQGYARTSLADVAKAASIPTGNVFYYFRAKTDLAKATVDEWCKLMEGYLSDMEIERDPWLRIERFIEQAGIFRETYITLGCPLAGLTRDLRQESDSKKIETRRIYALQFSWLIRQFEITGMENENAKMQANFLMAGHHGSILLAYAQNDPVIIDTQIEYLKAWLKGIQNQIMRSDCDKS